MNIASDFFIFNFSSSFIKFPQNKGTLLLTVPKFLSNIGHTIWILKIYCEIFRILVFQNGCIFFENKIIFRII